jgi:hypothetical protein
MKTNTQQSRWYIDLALFTAFIAAFFLDLTGLGLHQWLGIGVLAISLYHLITHWKWVKSVTSKFFSQSGQQSKFYYLIDAAILLGMLTIIGTGVVISSWLNLTMIDYPVWRTIHIVASAATLVLTVAKIGLHWRWIVATARKALSFTPAVAATAPALTRTSAAKPAPAARSYTRREFVGLMGLVGIASVVALSNTLKGLQFVTSTVAEASSNTVSGSTADIAAVPSTSSTAVTDPAAASIATTSPTTASIAVTAPTTTSTTASSTAVISPTAASTTVSAVSSQSQSSSACVISCNRNCYYPGRCRRYVDTNGNNRCDNSECVA